MKTLLTSTGGARWIALAALTVLVAGLAAAVWNWKPAGSPDTARRSAEPVTGAEPCEQVIARALGQAPRVQSSETLIDSAAYKRRWLDEVRGVDLSGLDHAKRELFLRFANAETCTCGCGFTLAGCRASDMTCDVSGPRLEALLDSVRTGRITRARGIRARPDGGG